MWTICLGAVHTKSSAAVPMSNRGYYSGEKIVPCEQAGITVYLPKPMTSGLLAKGRSGKQDFVHVAADDVYLCHHANQRLCVRRHGDSLFCPSC